MLKRRLTNATFVEIPVIICAKGIRVVYQVANAVIVKCTVLTISQIYVTSVQHEIISGSSR
jgi:hypothetical protein